MDKAIEEFIRTLQRIVAESEAIVKQIEDLTDIGESEERNIIDKKTTECIPDTTDEA